MKAILLAAGLGTRLNSDMPGIPKCMVDLGGKTLIKDTIRKLNNKGIDEIAVVVGYKANVVIENTKNDNVRFFLNPFYDRTNSIASLWFARDFLQGDDFLLLNADVFFASQILNELLDDGRSPVLFADKTRKEEADYKLCYDNNILIKHGKELRGAEISGEYIGIAKINKSFLPVFKKRLDELIGTQQHGLWWENVLYSLIVEMNIYISEIPQGLFWAEVDTIGDYNRIIDYLGSQKAGTI